MIATVMTYYEWSNWRQVVKCQWRTCYAGMGLAGNGICFAGGDFRQEDCSKYRNEDEWLNQEALRGEEVKE